MYFKNKDIKLGKGTQALIKFKLKNEKNISELEINWNHFLNDEAYEIFYKKGNFKAIDILVESYKN